MGNVRKLTKSRFKLAMECPRKLVYHGDPAYHDASEEDDFLKGLADCGHQVGALARLLYPGGVEITARKQEEQIRLTRDAMEKESVVLFEPTFAHGNCLVRVDVLVKEGNSVQLIEVKSKSLEPKKGFLGQNGRISSDWRPYLLDVAFQTHVLRSSNPGLRVEPYLMLVDPSVTNPIPHLGAMLRVQREGRSVVVAVDPALQNASIPRTLRLHAVADEVAMLLGSDIEGPERVPLPFATAVDALASALLHGQAPEPRLSRACKACQFHCEPGQPGASALSGWAECVRIATGGPVNVRRKETVFGLCKDKQTDKRLLTGKILLADLTESEIPFDGESPDCISTPHRRWLQCQEARGLIDRPVLAEAAVHEALASLRWPLHFIDFETGRYAVPLHAGTTPNELLLYQYSEHVLETDGSLRHSSQFLCSDAGELPNRATLDALRAALCRDDGTVVHWWNHENSVLKELRESLDPTDTADRERIAFINQLCGDDDGGAAPRLFDLGRLFDRCVYLPGTDARSSIKKVLPAVLRLASGVRDRFGRPEYGTPTCPSLNIRGPFAWVRRDARGALEDPYKLLPRFQGNAGLYMERESAGEVQEGAIVDGGGAMLAYATLQDPALSAPERGDLRAKMLRYTELDSLAMVMAFQFLQQYKQTRSVHNAVDRAQQAQAE